MSNDFTAGTTVKAVSKIHTCEHCWTEIPIGESAAKCSGKIEGTFYSDYFHVDCFEAGSVFASKFGQWGEDWPFLHDFAAEDRPWVKKNFPTVAKRLGWDQPE